jgi:DNA-directed RNA polymerase beta' subunit
VGVPLQVAKVMTYPERVSTANLERLRVVVRNGPGGYPGANIIRPAALGDSNTSFVKSLGWADERQRQKMAEGK